MFCGKLGAETEKAATKRSVSSSKLPVFSDSWQQTYCADCGARMGFISPEAKHGDKHYDSDSAFQYGNYRNTATECVSHYVKTSVLEAVILQAIQTVSKYVLENEAEFIDQLKAVWNEQQSRTANNGQHP